MDVSGPCRGQEDSARFSTQLGGTHQGQNGVPGLARRLQILNKTGKGLALSCHWGRCQLQREFPWRPSSSKELKCSQAKRGDETRGAVLRERSRTAQ